MNIHKIFILFLLLVGVFSSCQEKEIRIPITLESFADMADVKYRVDADLLSESLRHVVLADTDRETPDIQARRHYLDGGQLVWVTRNGISSKADTLLTYLATVDSIGFSSEKFCYSSLSSDLKRARDLDFDSDKDSRNNINKVYARLEYRLIQRLSCVMPRVCVLVLSIHTMPSIVLMCVTVVALTHLTVRCMMFLQSDLIPSLYLRHLL